MHGRTGKQLRGCAELTGCRLSIVVPTLEEAGGIADALATLRPLRARGHEVIVADGGSTDATPELAAPGANRIVAAPRGRARQMNAGAAVATGDVLLFLHADTVLPDDADTLVNEALGEAGSGWGHFGVRLTGPHPAFRVIERMISLRSRLSGIATGDQAIFATRDLFDSAGGFPDLPLLEDVEFCRRLKRVSRPVRPRAPVTTSSRRWEAAGIARTVWLMWWLRGAYALGVGPDRLARHYRFAGGAAREG